MRIQKRDGRVQEFDPKKITRAMLMAFHAVSRDVSPTTINELTERVVIRLQGPVPQGARLIGLEEIQNQVEEVLMEDYPQVARAFILYRQKRAEARAVRLAPDSRALADYIHPAKYARWFKATKRREIYPETVKRTEDMHIRKFPALERQIRNAFEYVYDQRVLPSMRCMQFGGLAIERNNARMYNCCFSLCDRPRFFAEAIWLLLSGCGVGFSVQWRHVDKLPRLARMSKRVIHFTVKDSIEGWADAIWQLTEASIAGEWVEFAYTGIRDEGSILETSGGLAPGHLPLRDTIESIREIFLRAQGRKLRPIECHDIVCYLAEAVLAGGIRRSSLISLFSVEDTEMLYAKADGNYVPGSVNAQRAMANNSAVLLRSIGDREYFDRILRIAQEGWGEPGFYFTDNLDYGTNPCGEIGLNPVIDGQTGWAFCNLCETNCAKFESATHMTEAVSAASFIGTLQATYTDFPYLGTISKSIAEREALLGVGLMGMMDRPDIAMNPANQRIAASHVNATNFTASGLMGINMAARTTTVKPGGTAPLEVGGVGSGIGRHHARRYLRRVTANPLEPVARYFRSINPHMVEEKPNGDLCLVFPCQPHSEALVLKDASAMDQVREVLSTYENWIMPGTVRKAISPGLTHNVSCTISLDESERQEVADHIWANRHCVAAMSFAPRDLDKKYPFAPREAIATAADEARWNELIAGYRPIDYTQMREEQDGTLLVQEAACAGGACQI